jgi:hemolysin D
LSNKSPKVVALRRLQTTPPALLTHDGLIDVEPGRELQLSPGHGRLTMTLCGLVLVALMACWFAKVDIYAVAQGRIQPVGRSKTVQPLTTGRITGIHVENGSEVQAGDLLLEIDPTENAADQEANTQQLEDLNAEIARRKTAIEMARSGKVDGTSPSIEFDSSVDARTRLREEGVLRDDLSNLRAILKSLDSKIFETSTQQRALQTTIAQLERLVATLKKRLDMHQTLLERGADSQSAVIDAQQTYELGASNLVTQKGELLKAGAAIQSAMADKQSSLSKFIADNSQAMATAQSKRDQVAQSLVKSSVRLDYTRLVATTSGVVQELTVTTLGQVVASGEHLLTIVPRDARLEAEGSVSNEDIGFVEVGQKAILKLDAFPYTLYGTISGKLTRVSHEAVDWRGAQTSVNGLPTERSSPPSPQQTPNLVYPVTVALESTSIMVDGKAIPLLPGMTATLEIRTGRRRLLHYILSPMVKVISEAGHER